MTYRYANAPRADERRFQEIVVRHLDLDDWLVVDLDDDGDLLGAPATSALRTVGPMFPPGSLAHVGALRRLDDGLLLSGEGGDEIFRARRISTIAILARLARHAETPTRARLQNSFEMLGPRRLREVAMLARLEREYAPDWLAPDVRRELLGRLAGLDAAEPLGGSAYLRYAAALPWVQVGHHNVRALHARFGLQWETPLFDPGFLGALARTHWHHFRGRTEILRLHFADLLPVEIIERRTKGLYNEAYLGRRTREFAEGWDGSGLPDDIDARWLKHHWCTADDIHAGTAPLLHQAWLATEGASGATTGADRVSP